MPMYEYRCRGCGQRFEEIRSLADSDERVECPECGAEAEKLFSSFASVSGTSGGGGAASGAGSGCSGPRGFS